VTTAAIGGQLAPAPAHRHLGMSADAVLPSVRAALDALRGPRLRAVGVAIPGTVHGHTLVEATNLRWRGVDLGGLTDLPLAVGNDASLAGVAEALRGAARDASVALHLTVEVGVGGVLIVEGRPVLGAAGAGGEFGHLPFGDPARHCPCGAWGCWDLEVDGRAMARHTGRRAPADPRAYAERTIAAALAGDGDAAAACRATATALGRGIGALLNAVDPAVVTLGGLGADLLSVAGPALHAGVRRGAMAWRRNDLPPVLPAALGSTGPAIGAAESAMALALTEQMLSV
jgi:predicted NBD/HSP70 family sugar kinase